MPCLRQKEFESLTLKDTTEEFATLCGRDTVQIRPSYPVSVDLTLLAKRYAPLGGSNTIASCSVFARMITPRFFPRWTRARTRN